ncbi:hypothetical protein, partial [Mediterraneibacter gnavus]
KILAIIIPENGAKVSKIKCFQFAQQTLYSTLKILHNRILRDISCLGADINVTVILFLMLIPDFEHNVPSPFDR